MFQPQTQEKLYSAEELWELSHAPENDGLRLELSEGVLIEMSPAGGKHGTLTMKLGRLIGDHVESNHLGETTAAETGYILFKNPDGKDTVRAPDVGFIAAARIPETGLPDGYVPFAPDLAVEVVSPNDDAETLEKKIGEYLKYGTKMVWVFYPNLKRAVVHTPSGSYPVGIDDTLDGGDVLPGFKLPMRDFFTR
jgi:Uma2 family endonuclease